MYMNPERYSLRVRQLGHQIRRMVLTGSLTDLRYDPHRHAGRRGRTSRTKCNVQLLTVHLSLPMQRMRTEETTCVDLQIDRSSAGW